MLVLAKASCGSAACHGVFIDSDSGDLYVVGDRTAAARPGETDAASRTVVEVDLTILTEAAGALRLAERSVGWSGGGTGPLVVKIAGGVAYVTGDPVAAPPADIGVAPHEEIVLAGRVDPAVVRTLAESLA